MLGAGIGVVKETVKKVKDKKKGEQLNEQQRQNDFEEFSSYKDEEGHEKSGSMRYGTSGYQHPSREEEE